MFGRVHHNKRTDLLSLMAGLDLYISKYRQEGNNTERLEKAKSLIEEELGLNTQTIHCPENGTLVPG